MTQLGGSATIYGILYQILGSLRGVASIQLRSAAPDASSVTLVLEPKGGGGDLRVCDAKGRRVEQWKSKADRGPWSLKTVLDGVIPDLYRALRDDLDERDEFWLETEGRLGDWKEFYDGLSSLPLTPGELDEKETVAKIKGAPVSTRGVVRYAAEQLPKDGRSQADRERRVLHVLRHFRLEPGVSMDALRAPLDRLLLAAVSSRDDIHGARERLYGHLVTILSGGACTLAPSEILKGAGLNVTAIEKLTNIAAIKAPLDDLLDRSLRSDYGYDRTADVRSPPSWTPGRSVLVLSGESGQGKSWQLASLLDHARRAGDLVMLCPRGRTSDRDVQVLADSVWKKILDHDTPKTFDRVIEHLRAVFGTTLGVPVVAVDGISDTTHAEDLVSSDWESLGVRLAITVSNARLARALERRFPDRVTHVPVRDLSPSEVKELLRSKGRDLSQVPSDLRSTLSRPLLASLYCQLAVDAAWNPKNEYELYERLWDERLRLALTQPDHPEDEACLASLAASLLDPGAAYPWPLASSSSAGCDPKVLSRLERVGWIRRRDGGDSEIWHDRLLNWAVAHGLLERFRAHRLTLTQLGDLLVGTWDPEKTFAGRRLGYVPMDTLWLACGPSASVQPRDIAYLLSRLSEKS